MSPRSDEEPDIGRTERAGARDILVATAIAGAAGYVLTAVAGWWLEPAEYARFAVFWAALFGVVAAASGVQHEASRALAPAGGKRAQTGPPVARRLALVAAAAFAGAIAASAPLWATRAFPEGALAMTCALIFGVACFVPFAVVLGVLYGKREFRTVAQLMVTDGTVRLALVIGALAIEASAPVIAWAVATPYAIALALLARPVWERVRSGYASDAAGPALAAKASKAVAAAATTGVLVSGLPFLIGVTSADASETEIGVFALALSVIRAPLVVVAMAFQSFLVVFFRERAGDSTVMRTLLVIAVVGGVSAAVAAAWGPAIQVGIFGEAYVLTSGTLAALLGSAAALAAMYVVAAALLAQDRHSANLVAWVVAVVSTVAVLAAPLDFDARMMLLVLAPPAAGLAVHLVALARHNRTP